MTRVIIFLVIVFAVVVTNVMAWRAIQSQPLPEIKTPIPVGSTLLHWDGFMAMKQSADGHWQIPAELLAYAGKTVTVDGVLFTMPQFVRAGKMEAAVLTPPSRFGCCGLQCSTKPQLMMLCLLSEPLIAPTTKTSVARVTGVLQFNPVGDAWTMSELTDAQIEWAP
jgi:heme/copper-type cytochrome/quinol oxidase subunit 4